MKRETVGATVRELGRHAAALLDELERTGRGIVISRYGRAVAYLGPLPDDYEPGSFERIHVLPRTQAMAALLPEEEVDDSVSEDDIADLKDRHRQMLEVLAASDGAWWRPASSQDFDLIPGGVGLELRGLAESRRTGGEWRLTPKGKRAFEVMRAA